MLFPADQCVLEKGEIVVLCVASGMQGVNLPRLTVDGKPVLWERFKPPALVARVNLSPGKHVIAVGKNELRVFVRDGENPGAAPEGWPVLRTHLGNVEQCRECAACHEVATNEGVQAVSAPQEPAACFRCHAEGQLEAIHFHPQEPLNSCHMCHALHGSANNALLRGPVKQLCAACHD